MLPNLWIWKYILVIQRVSKFDRKKGVVSFKKHFNTEQNPSENQYTYSAISNNQNDFFLSKRYFQFTHEPQDDIRINIGQETSWMTHPNSKKNLFWCGGFASEWEIKNGPQARTIDKKRFSELSEKAYMIAKPRFMCEKFLRLHWGIERESSTIKFPRWTNIVNTGADWSRWSRKTYRNFPVEIFALIKKSST